MKKLMIAAAAAAMVGVVGATEFVYDFTATLKTTTGNEKKTGEKETVNLGKDSNGKWWYQDEVFVLNGKSFKDFKYTDTKAEKTYIIEKALKAGSAQYPWKINTSVVKTDDDKRLIAEALGWSESSKHTKYNVQKWYKNKWVWCETFKFTLPGDCYRVSTTRTIKGYIEIEDLLCDDWSLYEKNDMDTEYAFEQKFFNFFNGLTFEKATKVEALFAWGDDMDSADGTNLGFVLAGQGNYTAKLVKIAGYDVEGLKDISGDIVGYLPAPDCEACCADAVMAIAFDCYETKYPTEIDEEDPSSEVEYLPTAAFGTWSMKFNKKLSFKDETLQELVK